jgi:hypothetical protein
MNTRQIRRHCTLVRAALIVVAVAILQGCAEEEKFKVVPVTGKVTVDGVPLSSAGVAFHPDNAKGNVIDHISAATTNADGEYELVTATRNGAPVGWYKVMVVPYSTPPMGGGRHVPPPGERPDFNKKYQRIDKTDLSIEVTEEPADGAYDIQLSK